MLGVNLHIINVSRISPLELEGVQMPDKEHANLNFLTATYWTRLKDGDIILLDEFLRGFPEVYNGLLDIMTSRQVGGFKLPKVFIIAASNSTIAYDKALEDRLLHVVVPDPRKLRAERDRLGQQLIDYIGLDPSTLKTFDMDEVLRQEVLPTYDILDSFKNHTAYGAASIEGCSIRNLIGQAKLRHIQSPTLMQLLKMNNVAAMRLNHPQYVVLPDGKNVDPKYLAAIPKLMASDKLTEIQRQNLLINSQLVELDQAKKGSMTSNVEEEYDDEIFAN